MVYDWKTSLKKKDNIILKWPLLFSSTMNGGGRYTLARVNKESSTMNGGGGDGRPRTGGGGEREKALVNFS